MAVVVVDRRRVVLGELGRETERIRRGAFASLQDHRTERSVFVVRSKRAVGGDDLGNVLVAVVRVEERCLVQGAWCLVQPNERTRRDGFRWIPDEVVVVGSRSRRVEVSDLEIAIVDETLVVLRHAAAHTIETHGDDRITLRPTHRAVFAVVLNLPDASRCLYQHLVAVVVELG